MCRYERVKATQKTGEATRDKWHKTDWTKVEKDPSSVSFTREDWIHKYDAAKEGEKLFNEISKKYII